jgi:hypothetical protein
MEAMLRQTAQEGRECLAVSAIDAASLRPLIERAGEILARNLIQEPETFTTRADEGGVAEGVSAAPDLEEEPEEVEQVARYPR